MWLFFVVVNYFSTATSIGYWLDFRHRSIYSFHSIQWRMHDSWSGFCYILNVQNDSFTSLRKGKSNQKWNEIEFIERIKKSIFPQFVLNNFTCFTLIRYLHKISSYLLLFCIRVYFFRWKKKDWSFNIFIVIILFLQFINAHSKLDGFK